MSGKSNKAIAIWNAISRLLWHWETEDEEVRILHKVSRNLRPTDLHVRNHNEKYVIGVESAEKAKQLLAAIDGLLRTPELLLQRDSKGNEDVPYRPRTKVIERMTAGPSYPSSARTPRKLSAIRSFRRYKQP